MKILFVTKTYYPPVGGVETQMRMVAHELTRRHQLEVAALLPSENGYIDGNMRVHSLKPSRVDGWRLSPLLLMRSNKKRETTWLGFRLLRSVYVRKLRPLVRDKHVVHAFNTSYLSWMAAEAARLEGVPFVLSPYFHPAEDGQISSRQLAQAKLYQRADIVFALLDTHRELLTKLGVAPERMRLAGVAPLLPEKTDPQGFRVRHGLGQKPIVLFIGRMVETKGVKALLAAASYIWQQIPDAQFIFIGNHDGQSPSWFTDRRDDRIRHLGLVGEQEKGDALAACDLFCMPSVAEILPAVYLEAWSYGKAVIGGTAYGLKELIEESGAGLTAKQDPELLASRVVELLQNETKRKSMGERGRELVERRFSKSAVVSALESAYAEIAGAR